MRLPRLPLTSTASPSRSVAGSEARQRRAVGRVQAAPRRRQRIVQEPHPAAAGVHAGRPSGPRLRPGPRVACGCARPAPACRPARRSGGGRQPAPARPAPHAPMRRRRCSSRRAGSRGHPGSGAWQPRPATGWKSASARAPAAISAPSACAAVSAARAFITMWRPGAATRNVSSCPPITATTSEPASSCSDARRSALPNGTVRTPDASPATDRRRANPPAAPGCRPAARRGDARLFVGDRVQAAQMADMGRLDIGDQRHVRPGQHGQRPYLAGLVHADLDHRVIVVRRQARQRQRHAPMVVVARRRGMRAPAGGQDERSISLVVVLPTLPVIAATDPVKRSRA